MTSVCVVFSVNMLWEVWFYVRHDMTHRLHVVSNRAAFALTECSVMTECWVVAELSR